MCGEGFPDFYAKNEMLQHECNGIILPFIYYLFGLCTPMADYEHGLDEQGNPLPEDCA